MAAREDVVVGSLDEVEDARVHAQGGGDAAGARGRQHRDAGRRLAVEGAVALDLLGHHRAPRRRHASFGGVDAVAGEVLLRQVHAPAVEVLADVAQEVRQLERVPERACRLLRRRRERLQHGQHHLPDHGGGALHVAVAQLLPGGPGGAGQVELHRPEEPVEALGVGAPALQAVDDGRHDRLVGAARRDAVPEVLLEASQPRGRVGLVVPGHRGVDALGLVDDVVGQPTEGVDGVHVDPLLARQQPGAPVVGGAVRPRQLGAPGVAGREPRVGVQGTGHGDTQPRTCGRATMGAVERGRT
ncbi:hypothetical protein AERYTH_16555 [Aeromicrobium erythreum]|uniref:Uncharacterized protein n=1 Tax=Aeromicrobium erythreum TaxID=2041 RepID=A0A0U4B0Y4_9ACTN|nr:hypothetical protein AERYTH_16555 [Aeromicrobium erythreum]